MGQIDSTVGWALALHAADLGLVPGILSSLQVLSGVIPELARRELCDSKTNKQKEMGLLTVSHFYKAGKAQ